MEGERSRSYAVLRECSKPRAAVNPLLQLLQKEENIFGLLGLTKNKKGCPVVTRSQELNFMYVLLVKAYLLLYS